MRSLLDEGYTVLLETSGERPLGNVPRAVHKIVDVKCPGSGEGGTFLMENLAALSPRDEVKFVIADRADYEFSREFTRQHQLDRKVASVIFSPAFRKDSAGRSAENALLDPRELVDWVLADGLNVRVGLQMHKFIWDAATKGVRKIAVIGDRRERRDLIPITRNDGVHGNGGDQSGVFVPLFSISTARSTRLLRVSSRFAPVIQRTYSFWCV
jgi:hypothetical protein